MPESACQSRDNPARLGVLSMQVAP